MCWNGSKSRRSRGPFFGPPKKHQRIGNTAGERNKRAVHISFGSFIGLKNGIILFLAILCDLFGMVKWPFETVKWPPTRGWKGHFESPGLRYCWWTKSEPPLWMFLKFCWSNRMTDFHSYIYTSILTAGFLFIKRLKEGPLTPLIGMKKPQLSIYKAIIGAP